MGGSIGRRVLVIGMAGSGKTTFSRALSARTGLPVVHLDVHYWKPGWVKPSEPEWREKQHILLAGDAWIADGNYHETADVPLGRADTVVLLDMPWWLSAWRAFVRGVRGPDGELPAGCEDSAVRRLPTSGRSSVGSGSAAVPSPPRPARSFRSTRRTRSCMFSGQSAMSASSWPT